MKADIENYVDNIISYPCASDIDAVIFELRVIASQPLIWFVNDRMKARPQ